MSVVRIALRKGIYLLITLTAAAGPTVPLADPVAAAGDVDAFLFSAGVSHGPIGGGLPTTVSYSFVNGACIAVAALPSYVDLPEGETGVCRSVTGTGELTVTCTTGAITADWTFTEPDNDLPVFDGSGVIINGIAILAGSPATAPAVPGQGYFDPGSPQPGSAVAVAAFLPDVGADCVRGGNLMSSVDAALVGVS